jgi:hypothetical protein
MPAKNAGAFRFPVILSRDKDFLLSLRVLAKRSLRRIKKSLTSRTGFMHRLGSRCSLGNPDRWSPVHGWYFPAVASWNRILWKS